MILKVLLLIVYVTTIAVISGGARTIAQKVANELNETVYINDCETNDIVDVVEPDSIDTA